MRKFALFALVLGCSPAKVGPATASATTRNLASAPPPAPDRLAMPTLDMPWSPPIMSAGDVGALAAALEKHPLVELRLGPRLDDGAAEHRITSVVASLSPKTSVALGQGESRLRSLIPGRLPLARVEETSAATRPRYQAGGVVLDVSRWRPTQSLARSRVVLALDEAQLDVDAWRRQPASAVGSCDVALAALGAGQERSLAVLEPFLDHADELLWTLYEAELERRLPQMRTALAKYADEKSRKEFPDEASFATHGCGRRYLQYVEQFAACEGEARGCLFAPRVFLREGARIGADEPDAFIPDDCANRVGTDYVSQMREIARGAARTAGEILDAKWSGLADRLGALTEVAAAMDDVCTPRRRRFAEADVDGARTQLAAIGDAFRAPEPTRDGARWLLDDDEFHVPGIGAVHQLARFDAGPSSASRRIADQARGLREFVRLRSQCGGKGGSLPLAAVLVDLDGKSVDFLGFFYEEELFCAQLPPLLARDE